jgi:hypothetical protein
VPRIIEDVDQGDHGDLGDHIPVRLLAGPGGKKSVEFEVDPAGQVLESISAWTVRAKRLLDDSDHNEPVRFREWSSGDTMAEV